jgi:SAM-dependent methyltransferase
VNTPSSARRQDLAFAAAIFLSSALLFLLEPIAGKRLLPLLGGSAAVWTACLVFFQSALLLGYYLAHWLITRTTPATQRRAYLGLLALSVVQLGVATRIELAADAMYPISSVMWMLTAMIGVAFVTLAVTSPLLQTWYVNARGVQPYRLYAISNVGSLLSLLVYPWLIEPRASMRSQTIGMTIGVALLVLVAAAVAYTARRAVAVETPVVEAEGGDDGPRQRVFWILLAACGSLLLSATTNHISQNVATIPLLWIVPLVAYLLSFVVAFMDERWRPRWLVLVVAAAGLGMVGYRQYKGDLRVPVPITVGIYCAALYAVCLFLHSELYRRRPAPARLTTFYFCLAFGGALGAVLVGIVAPMVLPGNYELMGGLFFAALLGFVATWRSGWWLRSATAAAAVAMGWLLVDQVHAYQGDVLTRVRNFYGTLKVDQDTSATYKAVMRTLHHGIIEHGQQIFRVDLDTAPTTYYGHASGAGMAIDLCCPGRSRRIGVIGLGTGTLAAYGRPGDVIRFYDINPAVEPIARRYFTYLRHSRARVEVVLGDARVSLEHEAPQQYDVIAVDAFTGDAIPVHLITSEALALYRRHLRPGGVVAFHVSNRYLDLAPVVRQLADHAGMRSILISNGDDLPHDVFTSDWVLVSANNSLFDLLAFSKDKDSIPVPPALRRWTDDYNSLLPILRRRHSDAP